MSTRSKRILIAVDGSDQAFEAVRYVAEMLNPDETKVVLFNVFSRLPENFFDVVDSPMIRQRLKEVRAWATQMKQAVDDFMGRATKLLEDHEFKGVEAIIQDRREGIARDIITKARESFDVVATGRRGMSELQDLALGSIATKLIGRLMKTPL